MSHMGCLLLGAPVPGAGICVLVKQLTEGGWGHVFVWFCSQSLSTQLCCSEVGGVGSSHSVGALCLAWCQRQAVCLRLWNVRGLGAASLGWCWSRWKAKKGRTGWVQREGWPSMCWFPPGLLDGDELWCASVSLSAGDVISGLWAA